MEPKQQINNPKYYITIGGECGVVDSIDLVIQLFCNRYNSVKDSTWIQNIIQEVKRLETRNNYNYIYREDSAPYVLFEIDKVSGDYSSWEQNNVYDLTASFRRSVERKSNILKSLGFARRNNGTEDGYLIGESYFIPFSVVSSWLTDLVDFGGFLKTFRPKGKLYKQMPEDAKQILKENRAKLREQGIII